MQCPFHGVIIPRDEHGNPVQTSSHNTVHSSEQLVEVSDIQSSSKEAGELWKDLQIQNDIMAAAKLDSQSYTGGTKKRKGNVVCSHIEATIMFSPLKLGSRGTKY